MPSFTEGDTALDGWTSRVLRIAERSIWGCACLFVCPLASAQKRSRTVVSRSVLLNYSQHVSGCQTQGIHRFCIGGWTMTTFGKQRQQQSLSWGWKQQPPAALSPPLSSALSPPLSPPQQKQRQRQQRKQPKYVSMKTSLVLSLCVLSCHLVLTPGLSLERSQPIDTLRTITSMRMGTQIDQHRRAFVEKLLMSGPAVTALSFLSNNEASADTGEGTVAGCQDGTLSAGKVVSHD